jgi:GNAT superfamily N-acetyltransferase
MTADALADEMIVPHRPDVPGLRFRHWRGFEDLAGMAAANQRARDDLGIEEVIDVEAMTRTYSHLDHCDLSTDLVIVELDGGTIGYLRVDWNDLTNGTRQFFSFGILEPAGRRKGIGQALLSWSEVRLAEIAATLPQDRTGQLFAYTRDRDPGATVLFERNGWQPVARGYDMVRPTLDDIEASPLPDGLVVRPVTEADRRTVWEAAREAFRDHRDEEEWTEADWETFKGDFPDVTPWVIAFDGDEVAGGILNRIDPAANAHHGWSRGVLQTVWTGAGWRRRGLARALIGRSLVALRDLGMTSAALDVDGANPNQAMNLYLSQGFEITTSSIDWRKPLPEATVSSAQPESL